MTVLSVAVFAPVDQARSQYFWAVASPGFGRGGARN